MRVSIGFDGRLSAAWRSAAMVAVVAIGDIDDSACAYDKAPSNDSSILPSELSNDFAISRCTLPDTAMLLVDACSSR